ncbi:MAG: hypothetical protein AABX51_05350 [Nanoarchaeota archaeon]
MKLESFAEFLLTYSWGLLIIGMVISTMAFLGYFDIKNLIPPRCEAEPPFKCIGLEVKNSSTIEVMLRSQSNDTILISTLTVLNANPPCGGLVNASVNGQVLPFIISPRDIIKLDVLCKTPWFSGDFLDADIQLTYSINFSLLNTSIRVNGIVE